MAVEDSVADAEGAVAARQALSVVQTKVDADDWALLCAVAEGQEYSNINAAQGANVVQLRVRVLRLRRRLLEGNDDSIASQTVDRAAA